MGDRTARVRQDKQAAGARLREAATRLQPHAMAHEVLPDLRGEILAARREAEAGVCVVLEAVERILGAEGLAPTLHGDAEMILEACGFNDLIGQRLDKVSRRLADLERRLAVLAENCGPDAELEETDEDRRARELILHGPAQSAPEIDQQGIDALFG